MAMHSDDEGDEKFGEKLSIEDEKEQFFMAVKYGLKKQLTTLLESNKDLVELVDADGNYAAHWGAKTGNIEIMQMLRENGARMDVLAKSNTGMTPMHWAASEGKIQSIHYLLDLGMCPDSRDAAGCTPLIIAAQHGQVHTVIYLVKLGADVSVVDSNGDTALHWGAYKGSLDIVGYLSYAMEKYLDLKDRYGQTPLHLATIRGNLSVVEYLVKECKRNCLLKDSNGSDCIDLAVTKKKPLVEWVLRRSVSPSVFHLARSMGWSRFCQCGVLKVLMCGNAPEDAGVWAWRTVFFSNLVATVISLQFMQEPLLADLVWSKYFNLIVQGMWWFCFLSCLLVGPGVVVDSPDANGRSNYDKALDLIVSKDGEIGDIKLCHSCHVQRPFRAKHDKFLRACVHKFDHHCPFVGNTVGRDNHRFFIGLTVFHQLCYFGFVYTSFYYGYRVQMSWFLLIFLIYGGFWDMMMMGLGSYHLQLVSTNMTTNESMGHSKYTYLKSQDGQFENPFCRGDPWLNILDTLFPYPNHFFSRDDVVAFIGRQGPMIGKAPGSCCDAHGHSHSHSHGHPPNENGTSPDDDAVPLLAKEKGDNAV